VLRLLRLPLSVPVSVLPGLSVLRLLRPGLFHRRRLWPAAGGARTGSGAGALPTAPRRARVGFRNALPHGRAALTGGARASARALRKFIHAESRRTRRRKRTPRTPRFRVPLFFGGPPMTVGVEFI